MCDGLSEDKGSQELVNYFELCVRFFGAVIILLFVFVFCALNLGCIFKGASVKLNQF